jgi:hypothetical protein
VKREQPKEEGELLLGAMLRQEELAFIKAVGNMELSPVLLWELRKAMAAEKKKALSATNLTRALRPSCIQAELVARFGPPLTRCSPTCAKG